MDLVSRLLPVSNESWASRSFGETNFPNIDNDFDRSCWIYTENEDNMQMIHIHISQLKQAQ